MEDRIVTGSAREPLPHLASPDWFLDKAYADTLAKRLPADGALAEGGLRG